MIKSPGARTRILYQWEDQDLNKRPGVIAYRSVITMRNDLHRMWRMFGYFEKRPSPLLHYINTATGPSCYGYSDIVMTDRCTNVSLVHEVTHAAGYGSLRNIHSPGFVRVYLARLAEWFNWELGELTMQAGLRKLL